MNDEELLIASVEDKMRLCNDNYMITNTSFLDIFQQSIVIKYLNRNKIKYILYGGFEDAERKAVIFLPDYINDFNSYIKDNPDDNPISAIKLYKDNFSNLSHRDYLGAVMGLGIKREMIGDIVTYKEGCTFTVLKTIEKYIIQNITSVGRGSVRIEKCSDFSIPIGDDNYETKRCYVSSMRADSVVSAVFLLSRSAASEKITRGEVIVNGVQLMKPDAHISFSSKIVIHGKGKVIIEEDAGITKKGRQAFIIKKYN